jgi:SH3-like domain-containing protein
MRRIATSLLVLGVVSGVLAGPFAAQAQTKEFRSVSATTVLLDGPSVKANKKFIAPKGMPVQVLSSAEQYYKVRDADGYEGFVEKKATSTQRTVVATTLVGLRISAAESGNLALRVERGVVLNFVETAGNGWVKVRHSDGAQGYVKTTEVWGL